MRDGRTLYVYNLPDNYSFNTIGTYPIKVTANNPTTDGCSGTQEINYDVVVFDAPKTNFSVVNNGCFTDSLKFSDITALTGRPVTKWNWDFGDNTTDSVKNPAKNIPLRVPIM